MFAGQKLTDIRMLYGYSRNELAAEIDVSEQAVWQYEQGHIQPKFEVLVKMNHLFGVNSRYFSSDSVIEYVADENIIAYRNSDRDQRSKTSAEAMYLNFITKHLVDFSKDVTIFNNAIGSIRDEIMRERDGVLDDESIEFAADKTRRFLDIKNNKSLITELEQNGIFIFEKALRSKTDAYSAWINNIPFIILSNSNKSFVRRNFDLAHELGHLILHHNLNITSLEKSEFNQREKEANFFASCFLLPREEFREDIQKIKTVSNPKCYEALKKKWFVSISAMGLRAYKIGEMSYQQNRYFFANMNKLNYKLVEPFDNEFPIIRPKKMTSLFDFVFTKKIMTLDYYLLKYQVNIPYLSNLFGIKEDFFRKYLTPIEQKQFNFEEIKNTKNLRSV